MKRSSLYPGFGKRALRPIDNNVVCNNNLPKPVMRGPTFRKNVFVPVSDYENYLDDMITNERKRYKGNERLLRMSMDNIENIRQKHVEYYENHTPDVVMEESRPVFSYDINSTTANGVAPFMILKDRYGNRAIPIKEKIKALKALGAPREYLINEMIKHEEKLKWKDDAGKVLDRVFSKFSSSSKSKPNKKNIFSIVKSFKALDISEVD